MLVTLNVLIKAWANECDSTSDIFTTEFVVGNLVAVVFNTAMLHGGYRVESGRVDTDRESLVISVSTFWFFFAFLPSVIFVTESYSIHGLLVLIATFVVWTLYAVNLYMNRNDTETRASVYNLLDIFSKNGAPRAPLLSPPPRAPLTPRRCAAQSSPWRWRCKCSRPARAAARESVSSICPFFAEGRAKKSVAHNA